MDIKYFDSEKLKIGCSINLVMGGHDHKLRVIKWILRKIDDKTSNENISMVIDKSDHIFGSFRGIIRQKLIFNKYSGEILQKFFKLKKKLWKLNLNSNINLITHDCINKIDLANDKTTMELSKLPNKYFNLWLDVDSYIKPKPNEIVSQYDWIIFGSEYLLTNTNTEKMYAKYFKFMEHLDESLNLEQFRNLFYELTENYGLVVIDNKNPSNKLVDKLFRLKGWDKLK